MSPTSKLPVLPLSPVIAERMTELLASWPREVTINNLGDVRSVSDATYPSSVGEHAADRPLDALDRHIPREDRPQGGADHAAGTR